MLEFYTDGGYFMHPILAAGIGATLVGVLQIVLRDAVRLRWATACGAASTLLLGLLGMVIGLINAFEATATAPPDMKAAMLSASVSIALNTTLFALIMVLPALVLLIVGSLVPGRGRVGG